jgi:putative SOS response-associated peptidase YedK
MSSTLINARAETAAEKPSFRSALKRRRCLIPATGFYEWPKKGANPIYVHLEQDPIFAFAGLWETWHGPDGEELDSCTILTTEPNDFMRQYHHRMAVVLSPDRYADWLTPTEMSGQEALSLLETVPQEMMQVYEVSKLVNNVGVDSPDCIEPVGGQATLL